jgi:hypothetical protein
VYIGFLRFVIDIVLLNAPQLQLLLLLPGAPVPAGANAVESEESHCAVLP